MSSAPWERPSTMTSASVDLAQLEPLLGRWAIHGANPWDESQPIQGEATFSWLEGGAFLIQRWRIAPDIFPDGIAVIGLDPDTGRLQQHYFDSRGVIRVYDLRVEDGLWSVWKDGPPFAQRYTGTFSEDGSVIEGGWHRTDDDGSWVHDFDLTYTRID
jgi:hypothetical protein